MPLPGGRRAAPLPTAALASGAQSYPRRHNLKRSPVEARAGAAGRARRTRRTRAPASGTRRARPLRGQEPRVRTEGVAHPPCRAPERAEPEIRCVITHSLRRSPHGSGRSSPSRDEPLTARLVGRCARASRSELARGRTYQPSSIERMPICSFCLHRGSEHDWTSPACSVRRCDCRRQHPRRLRGRCLVPGCGCRKYVPLTDRRKAVNSYIGRGQR
jgi:hypothetical protein